jgi:hypothetical protein
MKKAASLAAPTESILLDGIEYKLTENQCAINSFPASTFQFHEGVYHGGCSWPVHTLQACHILRSVTSIVLPHWISSATTSVFQACQRLRVIGFTAGSLLRELRRTAVFLDYTEPDLSPVR